MNTYKWLIRREYWENRGMLLLVPGALSGLLILFMLAAVFKGQNMGLHFDDGDMSGMSVGPGTTVQLGGRYLQMVVDGLSTIFPLMAAPLYLSLAFVVFFYALGALYDERRDRSILFWKSLPVSDAATVLSKALLALILIPFGMVVIALATAFVMLLIAGVGLALRGSNILPLLLTSPRLWLGPLKVLSLVPVYALWALPTVGWLLMVSSWARSKVFLWAVGTPVLAGAVLGWAQGGLGLAINAEWIAGNVIARLLTSVVPGTWLMSDSVRPLLPRGVGAENPGSVADSLYQLSWSSLGTPHLWIGAFAGAAMIGVAIWLRRRREEG